ncbi:Fic family protein [Haloferula sp. A504]|uniref:Fic family protein n=1 Tax=Haloferula sp. A504 TaxID=3373601 RepID=UPI0031C9E656|nr:Fic family protein [Verrucomicrobiaceae bacterium E54]
MKIPLPPVFQPTNEMLTLIASIDEFKGEWRALGKLGPGTLLTLRRIATIESAGSSTRIEGAKLSDGEVEQLVGKLGKESFRSRDEQEVAGYAYVMESIQTAWPDLRISESILLQLHRDLLRYSEKDERHRGQWKTLDNHVAAFDADGKQVAIIFETASPFETPVLMEQLLAWLAREEGDPVLHPLLRIAVFNVVFLAIHPFQDGNGRLSRVVTNLMLLRSGYAYASYTSLESVIEHHKDAYYLALRRTQTSFRHQADWEPWVLFFLRALKFQIERLRKRLPDSPAKGNAPPPPAALSPLAGRLLMLLETRQTLSVGDAAEALSANRNTLKDKFTELTENGFAELHGRGRGAHYRPVRNQGHAQASPTGGGAHRDHRPPADRSLKGG